MEPFVYMPEYPFVVCTECQFACVAAEVPSHLRTKHRHIQATERSRIAKIVDNIPGITRRQDQLRSFRFPAPTAAPVRFIAAPVSDGIRCDSCGFVVRTITGMRQHCREEHGWVSDWAKGGNVVKRAKEERAVPWTTGVRCQRFFRSRAASGWFEVGRVAGRKRPPTERIEASRRWSSGWNGCTEHRRRVSYCSILVRSKWLLRAPLIGRGPTPRGRSGYRCRGGNHSDRAGPKTTAKMPVRSCARMPRARRTRIRRRFVARTRGSPDAAVFHGISSFFGGSVGFG
ncbi:hypothetical protein C8A05DRAFT_20434 [Staphylotrichum tortipilum]|uniref:C2H2-type domain-containing protein n=1 Tax=Staphylotrichum tortipilum TaxID=2831512 RepID=A0AAN6M967_9PEZI|nr:hypothetical protein C8A05DRAFT_20434 [Staphylotrichum longicolle]